MTCSAGLQYSPFSAACRPGQYRLSIAIGKSPFRAIGLLTYTGNVVNSCEIGGTPDLQTPILVAMEDLIRSTIDQNYLVPTATGPVIYDSTTTITQQQFLDFLNLYYTTGTPNAIAQANVECLGSKLFVALQSAVMRSEEIATTAGSCARIPFLTIAGSCGSAIEIMLT